MDVSADGHAGLRRLLPFNYPLIISLAAEGTLPLADSRLSNAVWAAGLRSGASPESPSFHHSGCPASALVQMPLPDSL